MPRKFRVIAAAALAAVGAVSGVRAAGLGGNAPPVPAETKADAGWTRFVEPAEQAFSIEVPRGWQVEAGVPRARAAVFARLASPDGAVRIVIDDPRLMPLLNFPSVAGAPALPHSVPYMRAPDLVAAWGAPLVAEQCDAPRLERVRLRRDVAQAIDAAFSSRAALGGETVVADALFSCTRGGRQSLAYAAIGTHLYPVAGLLQFWQIDMEEIAVAPRAQLAATVATMNRSWGSVQWSASWVGRHQAIALGQNQAAIQNLDRMLHQSDLVDDIINGVGDFINPATGAKIQASAGHDAYCQDAAGSVFGLLAGATRADCQPLTPVN